LLRGMFGRAGENSGSDFAGGFNSLAGPKIQDGIKSSMERAGKDSSVHGGRAGNEWGSGFADTVTPKISDSIRRATADDSTNRKAGKNAASAFGDVFQR